MDKIKNKKLAFVLISAFIGIVLISSGVTYAYLTSSSSIENKVTVGKNDIEMNEEFDPPSDLIPGDKIKKKVWAENIGNIDTYIRAKIIFSDSDMEANCEALEIGDDWEYDQASNYYYYTKKVSPGGKTSPLINQVKIKENANSNDLKTFDVTVYMESKSNESATSYREVW